MSYESYMCVCVCVSGIFKSFIPKNKDNIKDPYK